MRSLVFLLTLLTLIILLIRAMVKLTRHASWVPTAKLMGLIVVVYGIAWLGFLLSRKQTTLPAGTPVCFDDWCATIIKADKITTGDSSSILLHIRMINNARGIAQSPSDPRVHILDSSGHEWGFSAYGQREYENRNGKQPGIGHRLELQQSMETVLAFRIPSSSHALRAKIEEGPWLTKLLFAEDEQVFAL